MRSVLACLVALSALSLTACGTGTGDPPSPGTPGGWSRQLVETRPGADAPTGLVADGDDVLVTVLSEDAVLTSHLSSDGGAFETGTPIEIEGGGYPRFADPVRLDDVWWLLGTGGMTGEGDAETLAHEPRALRSEDGLTWEQVDVTGIPGPVDLSRAVAVGGALVVAGDKRNDVDRSGGGASFEAAVWRSEDGATWSQVPLPGVVPLPGYEDESGVHHLAISGDRVLVGGSLSNRGAIWWSEDAGRTWARVESPEIDDLYVVSGLVAEGSTVVATGSVKGSDTGSRILHSTDGGTTYSVSADQPTATGEGYAPMWTGGGRFFTIGRPGFESMEDPALCYADLDSCYYGGESDVTVVFMSEDGDRWSVLDLSGADVNDEIVGLTGTPSGPTLLAHVDKGVVVSAWPPEAALPEGDAPAAPERVELVTVAEGERPEVGVRYHAPLYIHCGMEWLYLGDEPWQRTDGGPDVETGAGDGPVDGWPIAGQTIYGFATLGEDGVVQYSIGGEDDEVIATYEQTGAKAPGCD